MAATTSANVSNISVAKPKRDGGEPASYGFRERDEFTPVYGGMSSRWNPRSQRQYDGDNPFEYCDSWSV